MHPAMSRLTAVSALLLSVLVTPCALSTGVDSPATVPRFATVDLVFESASAYSAMSPFTNPFTEVTLVLDVRSPSGVRRSVAGFFDGDGRGGLRGRVFRARLGPDEPGVWSWRAHSNLAEFDGRRGRVRVADAGSGAFGHGPLVVTHGPRPRFAYADGTPVFLLGKFLDVDQEAPLRFSHTFFSDRMSEPDRERLFAHQRALGVNKINLYLANVGDYGGAAVMPWLGHPRLAWRSRFDLAFWRRVDAWVVRLGDAGIAAHFWFFADDSGFGRLSESERDLLVRYAMARLSAYPNSLFTVALEWQEGFTVEEIRHLGGQVQAANPWRRLVSVHSLDDKRGTPHNARLADESWVDFLDVQTGFVDARTIHEIGLHYRGFAGKPALLEEFSKGELNDVERAKTWAALTAAPAGIGTGTGIRAIANLITAVDLTALDPAPDLLRSGGGWAIAGDRQALIYLFAANSAELTERVKRFARARWFDPRDGAYKGSGFTPRAGAVPMRPDPRDWVLVLDRPVE